MTRGTWARLTDRRALACALALAGLSTCRAESQDPPSAAAAHVLFIGNSLTYFNTLPELVVRLARDMGDSTLSAEMVAHPSFSLADHWDEGSALDQLRLHKWTHVVLQQGPSALPESGALLLQWTERFAPPIRQSGAEPVLFMVWPDRARAGDMDAVRRHYRDAAAAVHGIFAPAGDAWTLAFADDPLAPLYGPDGFHPALEGSYVAAAVLLGRLRGVDPRQLPGSIPGSTLDEPRVRALQRAAAAALARNPARP